MPTYETLDAIADAVIPVLLGITLLFPAVPAVRARVGLLRWYGLVVAMLLGAYGLMFVDGWLGLWPSFAADYSTHTAVATALVGVWSLAGQRVLVVGTSILLAYLALMLYQHYHTVLDILSTAAVIVLLLIGVMAVSGGCVLRAAPTPKTS